MNSFNFVDTAAIHLMGVMLLNRSNSITSMEGYYAIAKEAYIAARELEKARVQHEENSNRRGESY